MKQSYASILTFGFLLGVRLITSVKTTKTVQESLSQAIQMNRDSATSWSELGLGGDDLNLQVIESSLMSMVKEGTSPSLKPGIEAIYNLTNDMMGAILNHSFSQQLKLNNSWNALQQCTAEDNQGQERFSYLKTIVSECQANASSYWNCANDCNQRCTTMNSEKEALRKLQCHSQAHDCTMQVQPLDNNTHVKAHIDSLRAFFRSVVEPNLTVDCNNTNQTNCTYECTWTCEEIVTNTTNCSSSVCDFEQTGCQVQHDACRTYNECYDTRAEEYNVTLKDVERDDEAMQSEYRAILRIQCLLNAFLVSIDDANGTGLDVGINYCINRTYHQYYCKCNSCDDSSLQDVMWNRFLGSNATHSETCSNNYRRDATSTGCDSCAQPYIPIFIVYSNETEMSQRKNCTSASFPALEPSFDLGVGTSAWDAQYYSQWPAQAILPNCAISPAICQANVTWNGADAPNVV